MNMLLNLGKPGDDGAFAPSWPIFTCANRPPAKSVSIRRATELQYRLVDRAALFGWAKERIEVIDDDLGKSGTSSDSRGGFQRLIAEIGLGKAGLVLSLDASRLARNNHDWHQLLGIVLAVWSADRRWRARVRSVAPIIDRLLPACPGS